MTPREQAIGLTGGLFGAAVTCIGAAGLSVPYARAPSINAFIGAAILAGLAAAWAAHRVSRDGVSEPLAESGARLAAWWGQSGEVLRLGRLAFDQSEAWRLVVAEEEAYEYAYAEGLA